MRLRHFVPTFVLLPARPFALALAGCGLLSSVPIAVSAASLQSIGRPAGDLESEAIGISANGSVVVGNSFGTAGPRAFVWSDDVLTPLPAPGEDFLFAEAISRDGTTVAGSILQVDGLGQVVSSEAFRWRSGTGVVGLGDAVGGAAQSVAFACSADGDIVVGRVNDADGGKAGRWDGPALSLVGPGDLAGGNVDGSAFDVSDDGSVIGGDTSVSTGFAGFRWTEATGMVALADLPGGQVESFVDGVSPDGSVLVGWSSSASGVEASRWVGAGAPGGLGDLPGGGFESYAYDVATGGNRIVGESLTADGFRAFLWDEQNQMRPLIDVLSGLGVDTTGWTLEVAYAISPDGNWVVGVAETPQGDTEGFVAYLPEPTGASSALAALLVLGGIAARRRGDRVGSCAPGREAQPRRAPAIPSLRDEPGPTHPGRRIPSP